jgi:deoxyadenosine/deoxycytidine kinase
MVVQSRDIERYEREWQTVVASQSNHRQGALPVLTVCGPSGAGKSSTVASLTSICPVFIETVEGNPHLNRFLERRKGFDAEGNQKWFLKQIERHIAGADPRSPVVLDQDPAAIVLVYSRMFMDEGGISKDQYALLLRQLLKIERALQRWRSPRRVLFLDAPADVLHKRVLGRLGASCTPPLQWFEKVRTRVQNLSTLFPHAVEASTVHRSLQQVISLATSLLEGPSRKFKRSSTAKEAMAGRK